MDETLATKFTELAQQFPHTIVMQTKTREGLIKYSYQDLYQKAQNIANLLQKKYNIKKGDRVAIVLENRPEWAAIYFGIMLLGAIAVPLDPQATPKDLQYCLQHSGCKVMFKGEKIEKLRQSKGTDADLTNVASILYTSGTTGVPKGVMLTHANFLANFESSVKLAIISAKDNLLSLLPLHHAFPFMVNLIVPLFSRTMITYVSDLSSETILTGMRATGVTVLVGVPQLYYMLHKNIVSRFKKIPWLLRMPFLGIITLGSFLHINKFILAQIHRMFGKKLRFLACGGAKLDVNVAKFFTKLGFTLLEGYGLTETAPIVTFNHYKHPKIGSVGKPIPGVKVKIVNPDKQGMGEVAISGANVMLGYYKLPQETQEVLKDNWFYSGDLGYLDKDGYLYIVGRKKELIILSSGKNVAPEEVEAHYAASPFIKEICVLAIGDRGEDKLMAVIVPDLEHFRKTGQVNIYETLKWHLENLSHNYPAYKRIMGFVIAKADLPRTRLGKLKRFAIKDMYTNELLGKGKAEIAEISLSNAELQILATNTAKQIMAVLRQQFKQEIQLTQHLEMDLGLDSLARVELMATLGRVFQIAIPKAVATETFTVKELIIAIEQLLTEQGRPPKITPQVSSWADILALEPAATITAKISLTPNWFATTCFFLLSWLVKLLGKIFWRLKVVGKENLPRNRTFIVCSNHNSYLDGFALIAVAPIWLRKKMFFLGYSGYFTVPVIRNIIKLIKVIPIDPAVHLLDAMQAAAYILRHDKIMCIFPEGARSIDGEIKVFKKGIGILAKELNMDIIPVYISGSYEAWPRSKRFPKPHAIKVVFGRPCNVKELQHAGKKLGAKDNYEAITLAIREEVMRLI